MFLPRRCPASECPRRLRSTSILSNNFGLRLGGNRIHTCGHLFGKLKRRSASRDFSFFLKKKTWVYAPIAPLAFHVIHRYRPIVHPVNVVAPIRGADAPCPILPEKCPNLRSVRSACFTWPANTVKRGGFMNLVRLAKMVPDTFLFSLSLFLMCRTLVLWGSMHRQCDGRSVCASCRPVPPFTKKAALY